MRYRAPTLLLLLLPLQLLADDDQPDPGASYSSGAFAYEIEPPAGTWVRWSALADDYAHADVGYLGVSGYGAVVMPVCWQGEKPSRLALLEVFLSRFGEDYPTPFVDSEAISSATKLSMTRITAITSGSLPMSVVPTRSRHGARRAIRTRCGICMNSGMA